MVDGNVIVAGGYNETEVLLKSCEVLDVKSGTTRPAPELPSKREVSIMYQLPCLSVGQCADAVVAGSSLYLLGGWDGTQALASTLRLPPGAKKWEELPPMATARNRPSAVVVQGS